jgi:hypothetical protein
MKFILNIFGLVRKKDVIKVLDEQINYWDDGMKNIGSSTIPTKLIPFYHQQFADYKQQSIHIKMIINTLK